MEGKAKSGDKPCHFKVDEFDDIQQNCLMKGDYGFTEGKPCIVVKMNKVFEFIPKLKKGSDVDYLKIKCDGEHAADKDNIGPIEYYPKQGYDLKYFPYLNQENYLSPLVFVKFLKPTTGVLIQVVCKPVNVENIEQDKHMRGDGRVHFELLIDYTRN